jgi:2-(1,2-epoxy-1,2-dihydrophenyl)acetyl-CoA isomerase
LACDLRVAADGARLRVGYARRGLSGDFGITFLLQMVVGGGRARELLLLDPDMTASEAQSFGLVNRVVKEADLRSVSADLAVRLASGPTMAYGKMKENLLAAATGDLDRAMGQEAINSRITAMTADCREAAIAFAEKRPARFIGR